MSQQNKESNSYRGNCKYQEHTLESILAAISRLLFMTQKDGKVDRIDTTVQT
jgi:hypothetical protein